MRAFLRYLVSAVLLVEVLGQDCRTTDHGRECSLPFEPKTFKVVDGRVILGAEDLLVSLNTQLEVERSIDVAPTEAHVNTCTIEYGIDAADCKNFIRVIQPLPGDDGRIMVCGTNAFFPTCNLHTAANLEEYVDMTPSDDVDEGFSPHSNVNNIVALLGSNSRFYSATHFTALQGQKTIGIAPNPLQQDSTFTVTTPNSDPLWLNKPDFISAYEIGQHIYFFIREEAYEVNTGGTVVYSRAVRFCKSDNGIGSSGTFLTFQKARMKCTKGSNNDRGTIPYDYNNLQATFFWESEDGTERYLYGVFSAPSNGPQGAAICKFSFDPEQSGSLVQVFEDREYNVPNINNPSVWSKQQTMNTFVCPGEQGNQRPPDEALNYLLTYNPVMSELEEPLHTVSCNTFTTITVDIIKYRGSKQEIFYYTMANGEIRQLVITEGVKHEHVITDIGGHVRDLIMHKNEDESRYVFATTEDKVVSIQRGECSRYESCFACLDSKDAYCGWDSDTNSCINKLKQQGPQTTESFKSTEEDVNRECGNRPPIDPIPTTRPTCRVARTSDTPGETPSGPDADNGEEEDCIPTVGSVDGLGPNREGAVEISVPELIGVSLGGFLVGIPVGLIVCGVFFAVCIRRRKRKDREHRAITISLSNGTTRSQTNNKVDQEQVQKKEQMLSPPPRYVQTGPFPPATSTTSLTIAPPTRQPPDVNHYLSPDEGDDDVIMPLPNPGGFHRQASAPVIWPPTASRLPASPGNSLPRRKVPGHAVPRGRTDSTTWLRANSESSDLSSPTSPIESQQEIML